MREGITLPPKQLTDAVGSSRRRHRGGGGESEVEESFVLCLQAATMVTDVLPFGVVGVRFGTMGTKHGGLVYVAAEVAPPVPPLFVSWLLLIS